MNAASGQESFLSYQRYRHLKIALGLTAVCLIVYLLPVADGIRRGDTIVGYGLGILGAALIVWLTWFGVRKRSYGAPGAPLRGWLSAHVYLGLTLPILVALHCAFRFGLNIHSLAYLLLVLTVGSGILGAALYRALPATNGAKHSREKLDSLIERIAEIDAECRNLAHALPDIYSDAAAIAIDETHLGGSLGTQLRGTDRRCGTTRAIELIESNIGSAAEVDRSTVNNLLTQLAWKKALLTTARGDIRRRAWLQVWLLAHVPLTFALLAALVVHIVVVLYL